MTTITINGKRIEVSGYQSVSVVNGTVTVGGKVVAEGLSGVVRIEWSGPLASLRSDAPVVVNGSVEGDLEAGGPVSCGSVGGSVTGSVINCGRVGGSVRGSVVNHN